MTFDEFVSKQRADLPELDAAMTELEIAYPTTKAYTEFLTTSNLNAFTFRHHRGVMVPAAAVAGEDIVTREDVATANLKLAPYGYTMSADLLQACFALTPARFHLFFDELFEMATKDARAIDFAKTVWPNYPHDVMQADLAVQYIANLFHYLSGGQWQPEFEIHVVNPALSQKDICALKQIPLCGKDGAVKLTIEMFTGQTPLSADDVEDLKFIMADQFFARSVANEMQNLLIPVKENLALYTAMVMTLLGNDIESQHCLSGYTTARDVLRLAAACSDGDISLATETHFKNFKRSERRFLLGLIEKTNNIAESMAQDGEVWKRLGERLHPGEYQNLYPETAKAFGLIRSGAYIETYNGKLEKLMKRPVNAEKLSEHLLQRPGLFARYLDFCLRNCKDDAERYRVAFRFTSVAQKVSPRVLLQVVNHFRNRNNTVQLAVGKRNGASAQSLTREIAPLDQAFCNNIADDIANEMWQLMRRDKTDTPSVYVDPDCHCEKLIFPDNVRQLISGSRVASCGSRFPLPDGDILRCFLYWKGDEISAFSGIDLDLSVAFMDADYSFSERNTISYYHPSIREIGGVHSGDRRCSGPNGSVEYVDFDLKAARRAGVRYVAMFVNSYSGIPFDQLESAFCGVMVRDGTGDTFEPSTVTNKYDLTAQSRDIVAVVLDLTRNEIVTVDRAVGTIARSNLSSSASSVSDVCRYAVELKSTALGRMLQYRFPSFAKEWEGADIIISDTPDKFIGKKDSARVISPFDTSGIVSLVFD